jgi:hypothetical protein
MIINGLETPPIWSSSQIALTQISSAKACASMREKVVQAETFEYGRNIGVISRLFNALI